MIVTMRPYKWLQINQSFTIVFKKKKPRRYINFAFRQLTFYTALHYMFADE